MLCIAEVKLRHNLEIQVCLLTVEACAKMKPEIKLLSLWLLSYVTFLLPSELHFLHKLITLCCVI